MDNKLSLFDNITKEEYDRMMICFHAGKRQYLPGEVIASYGEKSPLIGAVLEGKVLMLRTNYDGRQVILEQLSTGDIFGEALSSASSNTSLVQIICEKKAVVQFIDYSHLIKRCPNACPFHSQLTSNVLQLISQKAVRLSERLDLLSQRSIRDKLLLYFYQLTQKEGSDTFELPFSMSALANYLSVDRSAMMRELKKLKEEGLVKTNKRQITFCDKW